MELQTNAWVCGSNVVQQFLGIFTHYGFLVVASNVVPSDTIVVHVVQHRQARFGRLVDVEFGIVWLRDLLVAGLAPWVVSPAVRDLVGSWDLLAVVGPEPSVDVLGFQIGTVFTALEVAETTGRPDVGDIVLLDQTEDQVVLFLRLQRHQVHAVLAADVAAIQPVYSLIGKGGHVSTVEIVVSTVLELLRTW